MIKGKIPKNGIWNKINKFVLSSRSEEYQRLLSGVKVYSCFLKDKKFINSVFFSFIIMFFIITGFALLAEKNGWSLSIFIILPFILYPLSIVFVFLLQIWREYKFNLRKGLYILFRHGMSLILLIFLIILIVLSIFGESDYNKFFPIITFVFIFIGMRIGVLFLEIHEEFHPPSLIKYANEKLNHIISQYKKDNKYMNKYKQYQLFYFAIFCYYQRIETRIKNNYGNDLILFLRINNIRLLASQIFYNTTYHWRKLKNYLDRLQDSDPIENSKEYIQLMNEIKNEFGEFISNGKEEIIFKDLMKKKSNLDRIKVYLIFLMPPISYAISFYLKNYFNL